MWRRDACGLSIIQTKILSMILFCHLYITLKEHGVNDLLLSTLRHSQTLERKCCSWYFPVTFTSLSDTQRTWCQWYFPVILMSLSDTQAIRMPVMCTVKCSWTGTCEDGQYRSYILWDISSQWVKSIICILWHLVTMGKLWIIHIIGLWCDSRCWICWIHMLQDIWWSVWLILWDISAL